MGKDLVEHDVPTDEFGRPPGSVQVRVSPKNLLVKAHYGQTEIVPRVLVDPTRKYEVLGASRPLKDADVVRVKQVFHDGSPGSSGSRPVLRNSRP